MEETYPTKAIILNKTDFKEFDSLVSIYSVDKGKLDLVARGTKKIKSKLSGHTEPISLSDIMVIKGKAYDYIGGASVKDGFFNIKNNLDKLVTVGKSLRVFNQMIKGEEKYDAKMLYNFLLKYLKLINNYELDPLNYELLHSVFALKLLSISGYKPELYSCVLCQEEIKPEKIYFDFSKGGVVCRECARAGLTKISEDCIKILRIGINNEFKEIIKIKISEKQAREVSKMVNNYYNYYANI